MLLTLKQEDQVILPNPRASFTVKSSRNNGGSGPNTHLYAWDGREEEGEDGARFLYCHFITIDSWLEPTVIALNQCRILARTGSDKWPSTHCRFQPRTSSDVDLHCRFLSIPNHFLIFKLKTDSEGTLFHCNQVRKISDTVFFLLSSILWFTCM